MSSHDRKFMEKLTELMEKNMDNGDLIVDDLVQDVYKRQTMQDVWKSQSVENLLTTKFYDLPHFCSKEIDVYKRQHLSGEGLFAERSAICDRKW